MPVERSSNTMPRMKFRGAADEYFWLSCLCFGLAYWWQSGEADIKIRCNFPCQRPSEMQGHGKEMAYVHNFAEKQPPHSPKPLVNTHSEFLVIREQKMRKTFK